MSNCREILELAGHMRRIIERIEERMREEMEGEELTRVQELAGLKKPRDGDLDEKWGEPTVVAPSEKGKYKGKTLADLRSSLAALKKTGPHKQGSPEFGRMRELQFAIRAKTGWGKVGKEQ